MNSRIHKHSRTSRAKIRARIQTSSAPHKAPMPTIRTITSHWVSLRTRGISSHLPSRMPSHWRPIRITIIRLLGSRAIWEERTLNIWIFHSSNSSSSSNSRISSHTRLIPWAVVPQHVTRIHSRFLKAWAPVMRTATQSTIRPYSKLGRIVKARLDSVRMMEWWIDLGSCRVNKILWTKFKISHQFSLCLLSRIWTSISPNLWLASPTSNRAPNLRLPSQWTRNKWTNSQMAINLLKISQISSNRPETQQHLEPLEAIIHQIAWVSRMIFSISSPPWCPQYRTT